jgi:hypothetical protein
MKKFAISLIALAAISTASFASSNRSEDLRDLDTYVGQYADQAPVYSTSEKAFSVRSNSSAPTSLELLKRNQEKNESSSH